VAEERFLTVPEAADMLRIAPETVRRWLRSGRLKGVSLGSDRAGWRIPRSEVRRLLGLDGVEAVERRGPESNTTD
jgi:excisionase family DNA binding protein